MTYRVTKEQLLEHCRRMQEPQIDRGCVIDWVEEESRRLRDIAYRSSISPTTGKRVVCDWYGNEYEIREPLLSRLPMVPTFGITAEDTCPYPSRR